MSLEMKKILATVVPFTDEHLAQLRALVPDCEVVYKQKGLTADDVADADVILGNPAPALLSNCTRLKLLQLGSAGYDNYIAAKTLPQGCLLTSAVGAFGPSVSEHMMAQTFALIRRFDQYIANQLSCTWKVRGKVTSVDGSTVLVLGIGDIGGRYAKMMKACGAHVIGMRRHAGELPDWLDELYTIDRLDEILPRADIVAMVLPGGDSTYHILDGRRLSLLKPGAFVINVGRGTAIDPAALKDCLRKGRLAGVALDVTEPEPLPADDELWHAERVIITPHVAGGYHLAATVDRIAAIAMENVAALISGKKLRNLVTTE